MTAPICSVVIPTYNGKDLLAICLASVARHRPANFPLEIIVADDASTDGTPEWLASHYPEVRIVRLEKNSGFCGASNAGIQAASGSFVQLLNNDTEVMEGWLQAGLAPFSDPRVGSVAPLVLVRSNPERVDSAGDNFVWAGWPTKRGHGEAASAWIAHSVEPVFGASGSSAFYRAEALQKAGVFDASFGSYYEDVDLAFRLRWAGYTCLFASGSRILHEVSASYDHARPALQRRMARNAEILFWTDLPLRWLALAVAPHVAFIAAQAAWRLARGRAKPFLTGKMDALRMVPSFPGRRKLRGDLARTAVAPPQFPLKFGVLGDLRNHWRRPSERSAERLKGASSAESARRPGG